MRLSMKTYSSRPQKQNQDFGKRDYRTPLINVPDFLCIIHQ